jgi:hypothetical protein
LQAPQLFVSVLPSVSQPLFGLPSQSRNPGEQLMAHLPALQTAVEFGPAGQALPQVPQLFALFVVFVSQPFAGSMSQSAKPALHELRVQVLNGGVGLLFGMHCDVEFGKLQVSLQKLQFVLVPSVVAQTPTGSPVQLAVPVAQLSPHTPF